MIPYIGVSFFYTETKRNIKKCLDLILQEISKCASEIMNLEQIKSLVAAYLSCKDTEKIINDAGSFLFTEASCPLLDKPREEIFAALIDGLSDTDADRVYDLLQQGNAEDIYLIRIGALHE